MNEAYLFLLLFTTLLEQKKIGRPRSDADPTYKHTIVTARTRTFSLAQFYDAHIRCLIFDFGGPWAHGRKGVRPSTHVVHDEDHEHEMRAVPLTMSS